MSEIHRTMNQWNRRMGDSLPQPNTYIPHRWGADAMPAHARMSSSAKVCHIHASQESTFIDTLCVTVRPTVSPPALSVYYFAVLCMSGTPNLLASTSVLTSPSPSPSLAPCLGLLTPLTVSHCISRHSLLIFPRSTPPTCCRKCSAALSVALDDSPLLPLPSLLSLPAAFGLFVRFFFGPPLGLRRVFTSAAQSALLTHTSAKANSQMEARVLSEPTMERLVAVGLARR
mmetsp:Transcript_3482/g.8686  ORF Transcript_3482/g.8686 Transcript_3482/m.8686 type:complete len:229 (-) Transcript_3482:407-1093(-)